MDHPVQSGDAGDVGDGPAENAMPIAAPGRPTARTVQPGEEELIAFEPGDGPVHVSTRWPGDGDIVLKLVSPSGVEYTRDRPSQGVTHEVGPTFESFHLATPEPGTWTASLTGVGVPREGAPVRLTIHRERPPRSATAPRIEQEVSGAQVTASVLVDDLRIEAYLWEFGDGTTSHEGPQVRHTYRTNGSFRISVAVQDTAGHWHVATAGEQIVVR